jgi:hypothetical protein
VFAPALAECIARGVMRDHAARLYGPAPAKAAP